MGAGKKQPSKENPDDKRPKEERNAAGQTWESVLRFAIG